MTAAARHSRGPPLGTDPRAFLLAIDRCRIVLKNAVKSGAEAPPQLFAVVSAAARTYDAGAPELVAQVRRLFVRAGAGSETGLRCQRLLAHAGGPVAVGSLEDALEGQGRAPRIALAALADAAAREVPGAFSPLAAALDGVHRTDAAMLLSHLGTEDAVDALARHVRSPGHVGVHAAGALLSMDDDAIAFESLCERLCDASEAVLAARTLAGAAPGARWLREAEALLARWARRGITLAGAGRRVAAAELTALGHTGDVEAVMRALSSVDDELVITGAAAAYSLGDTERARAAALRLLRRGPSAAGPAFTLLVEWADLGDQRAGALVRHVIAARPVDLARSVFFDALAQTEKPALNTVVTRALGGSDEGAALEAARVVARLHEPPSIVPPLWL